MPDTDSPYALTRRFVPADTDPTDWAQVRPLLDALLARELDRGDAVVRYMDDWAELMAVVWERGTRVNIAKAADAESPKADAAYTHWVKDIQPRLAPIDDQLRKKLLASGYLDALPSERFGPLLRNWKAAADLFREASVPLFTELSTLATDYDKLVGAIEVELDGQRYTPPQLARFYESTDRSLRERAWAGEADQRLAVRGEIDAIFTRQVALRQQVAANAGKADFLDWVWQDKYRFDYSRADCADFAETIERVCVPRVRALNEQRCKDMGLDSLRPWDTMVDPRGRPGLEPFASDDAQGLVDGCQSIFERVGGGLADDFAQMKMGRNLDLVSRRGKRAGGFQASLREVREPFIFMNTAGRQADVVVMLHEVGHALHYMWNSRSDPCGFVHGAPIEFCEVASMGLELIGMPEVGVFYVGDEAASRRARREHLEKIIRFFPWMATVDRFQFWLYENPDHTTEQRDAAWLQLMDRFGSRSGGVGVDWSGIEDQLACYWHRQIHFFHHPLYYVEYGIAQLGALQLWLNYREDPKQALADYRHALSLGNRRTLPELFEAAGLKLDFSASILEPLIGAVEQEHTRLS
ncbi:MAG: M3 family oligoendopeptidase [Planctomycetota bacterium]